jgi:hypothetical protein
VIRGLDVVTVKELRGHPTVTITMRYPHTDMDSKREAVQNLVPHCDNIVRMTPKGRRAWKLQHGKSFVL